MTITAYFSLKKFENKGRVRRSSVECNSNRREKENVRIYCKSDRLRKIAISSKINELSFCGNKGHGIVFASIVRLNQD